MPSIKTSFLIINIIIIIIIIIIISLLILFIGRLLVTNLRLIWHSQSMPRVNLCKCLDYKLSVLFKHGLPYSPVYRIKVTFIFCKLSWNFTLHILHRESLFFVLSLLQP